MLKADFTQIISLSFASQYTFKDLVANLDKPLNEMGFKGHSINFELNGSKALISKVKD